MGLVGDSDSAELARTRLETCASARRRADNDTVLGVRLPRLLDALARANEGDIGPLLALRKQGVPTGTLARLIGASLPLDSVLPDPRSVGLEVATGAHEWSLASSRLPERLRGWDWDEATEGVDETALPRRELLVGRVTRLLAEERPNVAALLLPELEAMPVEAEHLEAEAALWTGLANALASLGDLKGAARAGAWAGWRPSAFRQIDKDAPPWFCAAPPDLNLAALRAGAELTTKEDRERAHRIVQNTWARAHRASEEAGEKPPPNPTAGSPEEASALIAVRRVMAADDAAALVIALRSCGLVAAAKGALERLAKDLPLQPNAADTNWLRRGILLAQQAVSLGDVDLARAILAPVLNAPGGPAKVVAKNGDRDAIGLLQVVLALNERDAAYDLIESYDGSRVSVACAAARLGDVDLALDQIGKAPVTDTLEIQTCALRALAGLPFGPMWEDP